MKWPFSRRFEKDLVPAFNKAAAEAPVPALVLPKKKGTEKGDE